MVSGITGKRQRKLRSVALIAASLAVLLTFVPALAAQEGPGSVPQDPTAVDQYEPSPDTPVEQPGIPVTPPGVCEHAPGQFLVGYVSQEALQAAPPENVAETYASLPAQLLVFPEIASIADPETRFVAEEAKIQELAARPGVAYVEYNCMMSAAALAEATGGESIIESPPACASCGVFVSEVADAVLSDGPEARDAYDTALGAARAGGDNVAFAAESGEESAASGGGGSSSTGDSATGGDSGSDEEDESGSEEKAAGSDTEEETTSGESASEETEEGSASNVAASGTRAAGNYPVLALGGAALLVTGIFVARRILRA